MFLTIKLCTHANFGGKDGYHLSRSVSPHYYIYNIYNIFGGKIITMKTEF